MHRPNDHERDYSGEAEPEYLGFSERLACGHTVEASEDSGGFDEVPRVTEKMVRDLLAFKVRVHNCELTEKITKAVVDVGTRLLDRDLTIAEINALTNRLSPEEGKQ